MNATIYGEITNDGEHIALVAAGSDPQAIAQASRAIQLMTPLVKPSDPRGALVLPLTWPAVVQLAFDFGIHWVPMEKLLAWIREQTEIRTSDLDSGLQFDVPDGLLPRDYQITGANLIARLGSAILTDEQRTGKTITTILGLMQRQATYSDAFPVFVAAPAGTVDLGWIRAWQTWAPHLTTVAWRGPKRVELLKTVQAGVMDIVPDVYVGSFETMRANAQETSKHKTKAALLHAGIQTFVLDEMHYIANRKAKRTLAAGRIGRNVPYFIGLGGTPIKKHTGDFYSTLAVMNEPAWPAGQRWDDRYLAQTVEDYGVETFGLAAHREPEFRMTLLGQMRRVSRADVLADLPEKVYTVRVVDIPSEWRKTYDDFEAKMLAELPDSEEEISVMSVFTQFGHLIRLASSACDVEYSIKQRTNPDTGEEEDYESMSLHPKLPSWKVDELLAVLSEREDEQCLVFAESRRLIQLAAVTAAEAGHSVALLVGGMSDKVRVQNVDAFQNGFVRHLFCTTGAGGTGLTLTAGGTMVFLQRPLSMVASMQAEDRSSGIGSEKHDCIEVIDIIARDTVEDRIRELLTTKAGQLSELVKDPRIIAQMLGGNNATYIDPREVEKP